MAGQPFDVGRTVVLWKDPQGFDAYQVRCIDQHGGCCDSDSKRYGSRKLEHDTVEDMQQQVSQLVLHFDGCVNSRSCFKSMHNRTAPQRRTAAGCRRTSWSTPTARSTRRWIWSSARSTPRRPTPPRSASRSATAARSTAASGPSCPPSTARAPRATSLINGEHHEAYDFRPEQYDSLVALARTLLRVFPKIKPQIPERNGQVIMDTLPDPMSFAGILGHLHVDLQRQKWDPGALDWHRLMRALNGFELPVQIRSFTDLPRTQQDLVSARRAAFYNAEERATGFFPVAAGRLWHSGVHIRAALGSGVHAPTRGRIIAARNATAGASSRSFVLIRHDLDVDDEPVTFYSLIAHIALPSLGSYEANTIPWLQSVAHGPVAIRAALEAGEVVNIDERVEAGDVVGHVGTVSRGPEQGPEIHFEIFTTERLGGDFGRAFHYINAAGDGPITRRADLINMADRSGDQELSADELRQFLPLRRPGQAPGAAPGGDPPPPRVGRPHHRSRVRRPARAGRASRKPSASACTRSPSRPTSSGPTSCRASPACPPTRPSIRTTR